MKKSKTPSVPSGEPNPSNYGFPETAETYYVRGVCNYLKHKLVESVADFTTAIEMNPNYGEAYCVRAIVKEHLDDREGAKLDFKKGRELKPSFADGLEKFRT